MTQPARLGKPTIRCTNYDQHCLAVDWTQDGRIALYNTSDPDGPSIHLTWVQFGCWVRHMRLAGSVFDSELFEQVNLGSRWLVRIRGSFEEPVSLNSEEIKDFLHGVLDGVFRQYTCPREEQPVA